VRTSRVYIEGPLAAGSRSRLRGGAANHVIRVLRLRAGDALVVFDGTGGEYPATIDELGKDTVVVTLGEHRGLERESPLVITLAQGIARAERMDWVVQKATELGVARIVPLVTERSVVRLDAQQAQTRLRHWRAVVIAACEQCGRNRLPEVAAPTSLADLLSAVPSGSVRLMPSPGAALRARDLDPQTQSVIVLVGPEGGFCESEQQAAERSGFRALTLGPRVLRTETAALATLVALQERLGDG
jgi:16S rRNA (uracil1498-N3)-methyltransferase